MNNINQHQISSLEQIFTSDSQSQFDPSHDDFLEQMLSSTAAFPWGDVDHAPPQSEEHSTAVLASKLMQHQISNGAGAKALMLQQQLLLAADGGFFPVANNHNDVVESFNTLLDASAFNGFAVGQTSSQPEAQPSAGQQPRQRVRARRGQATDPHSIAERLRRERIAERMKALQELVPNGNKTDKASMLDEIIDYVKFLQLQVKVLSMSRLGGAGAVAAAPSHEARSGNRTQTVSSPNNNKSEGTTTVAEQQVVKLMEEDMGSAMQYLQGKGLCLMPISLATAISTSHSRKPPLILLNSDGRSPTSPSISALTVQSAVIPTLKDSSSPST